MTSYEGCAHIKVSAWAKISAAGQDLNLTEVFGQDQNPDVRGIVQVSSFVAFSS
jgi:hypothetical protein